MWQLGMAALVGTFASVLVVVAHFVVTRLPVPATAACEAIVVLGHALHPDVDAVQPRGILERRLQLAVIAALEVGADVADIPEGNYPAVAGSRAFVLSGGVPRNRSRSEAAAMHEWLRQHALEEELRSHGWVVEIENRSVSTRTNAVYTLEQLLALPLPRPGVVCVATSPFHRWRSLRTFRQAAIELGWLGVAFAVPRRDLSSATPAGPTGAATPGAIFAEECPHALRDAAAILYYKIRGWLA